MRYRHQRQLGFTMMELMITITIMAILAAIAAPSFQNASLNDQLRSIANDVVSSAYLARSEAFKRNAVVTVCVSSDGVNCVTGGWEKGWIVKSGSTVLDRQLAAPNGYKVTATGGNSTLQFQPTGAGTTSESLVICRATPSVGSQRRVVTIDAAGRPYVTQSSTSTCS